MIPSGLPNQLSPLCGPIDAKADTVEQRRTNVEERPIRSRSICHIVAFVEQVLHRGKKFEVARQIPSDLKIHGVKASERMLVLIVVKLVPDKAPLQTEQEARRIQ